MTKAIVDEKNYTVVSGNGYRAGPMEREAAFKDAKKIYNFCVMYGREAKVQVYYRDGTEVDWRGVLENDG
jgi:hypothetical protein